MEAPVRWIIVSSPRENHNTVPCFVVAKVFIQLNLVNEPMAEKRHLHRLTTETLEAVILGQNHKIRDLGLSSVYIEGDWHACETGSPVYFWIKPCDIKDVRAVVARGRVVRHEPGVGAAVEFVAEDFAWPLRFTRAFENGQPSLLFS